MKGTDKEQFELWLCLTAGGFWGTSVSFIFKTTPLGAEISAMTAKKHKRLRRYHEKKKTKKKKMELTGERIEISWLWFPTH